MGNGQCEKYNGVIWKAITLACRSQGLEIKHRASVLPSALRSIQSLLCITINETPHERMFTFSRKSRFGESIPSWLSNAGPVLLKRHNCQSKFDSYVEQVKLLEAIHHMHISDIIMAEKLLSLYVILHRVLSQF